VGREVLRWQTERARQVIAEREASEEVPIPWRIVVMHLERLKDRSRMCEAAGFSAIRWFHDMVRPLTAPDADPVPDLAVPGGLEVTAWAQERDEAVRLAHNEAFAGHWGSQPRDAESWKNWTVGHRTFRRDWSWLVTDSSAVDADGRPEVAGYVASHAYPQDWEAQGYSQGWIGLLGVRPAWRGRGLAPALLAAAMRSYVQDGIETAGLDVDTGNASGALNLYSGMGFRVEHTQVAWAIESPGAAGL
jgi:ribosomal protein S18 acetylase RimI-like enzyme